MDIKNNDKLKEDAWIQIWNSTTNYLLAFESLANYLWTSLSSSVTQKWYAPYKVGVKSRIKLLYFQYSI